MCSAFNACVSDNASLNRQKTLVEQRLTDFIKINNRTFEIVDSQRTINNGCSELCTIVCKLCIITY